MLSTAQPASFDIDSCRCFLRKFFLDRFLNLRVHPDNFLRVRIEVMFDRNVVEAKNEIRLCSGVDQEKK